ncbi:MAG: ribosome-associated translation inhibitor RaiA [candidate division WOR-3 bacterium]
MKLNLTGRHFEITPNLRRHVDSKVSKFDKFNDLVLAGEIVLFKDHVNDIAEGRLHLRTAVIAAKGEGPDMYAAVTDLVDKLMVQLRRHEGKLHDRRRTRGGRIE